MKHRMTQKMYQLLREGGGSDGISCGDDTFAVQPMLHRLIEAMNTRHVLMHPPVVPKLWLFARERAATKFSGIERS